MDEENEEDIMSIKTIRRIAASLLNCGESRVIFDPSRLEEISKAVTKEDVRALIKNKAISKARKKGVSRSIGKIRAERKKRRGSGIGSRRGSKKTRSLSLGWTERIRAQRALLRKLNLKVGYREVYKKIKGGEFKDRAHLLMFLKERGYLK